MSSISNISLLREWLQHCDEHHRKCMRPSRSRNFWPKRIIFINDFLSGKLTLVEAESLEEDYLVLSHRWGNPTEDDITRFCTTPENYQNRLQGFSYDELPKTFQDAVKITRALGKQYLWIDSLCIIQRSSDDWDSQAKTMQDIFANAYCTIAATSAHSWEDGFLTPQPCTPDDQAQNTSTSPGCECDFNKDVDEGPLMQRAWVLQERVLSRRTIHFTTAHVYCECGDGVICEGLVKLKPPFGKQYFILDPQFPDRLCLSGYLRTVQFVQFLFQKYSASGITKETDRAVAIDSLITRINEVLRTNSHYGIFSLFLGPLLLWKRTQENGPRIQYSTDLVVPSWSWMAYSGGIDFILEPTVRFLVPRRNDLDFADDGRALNVKVRNFGASCRAEKKEEKYVILNGTEEVGSLWFDMADQVQFKDCNCVVIGTLRDGKEDARKDYYVIVIWKISGRHRRYKRVGVGMLEAQYISRDCISGRLF
ncbi:heterokaryon incompatibility protein-domain-containing protein [Cladorrhinum sp. PSN259]|nr:heterokaryon incompatibility protein-domain-containing protein [Cladorrhinum sp. PSN259]